MKHEVLRMERVTREISGEVYLDNINLHIFQGEIMGFLAQESEGKQEFIALLEQNLPILYGRIYLDGKIINSYAGSNYQYNKIHVIGQTSRLVEDLTVADNIFVLRRGFKKYWINKKILGTQVELLLKEYQISIPSDQSIRQLTPLERCVVELLRARLMGCRLIVLHDLSDFLNYQELVKFHQVIHTFCDQGYAFLYMGNHHEDVFKISNRTILFSNRRIKKIFDHHEMDDAHIAPYILSFGLSEKSNRELGEEKILEFDHINGNGMKDFCLSVKKGECVAILDRDNTVLDDIKQMMIGGIQPWTGEIRFNDKPYTVKMAESFLMHKLAIIQENPIQTMVFPDLSYLGNLTFLLDQKLNKKVLKTRYLQSVKKEYESLIGDNIHLKDLRNADPESLYELVYYRIHLYNPAIVFCVNPFAFGDMGCRNRILDLIQDLKNKGCTMVLLLVNISDSLQVADRLVVAAGGKVEKEFLKEEFYLVQR